MDRNEKLKLRYVTIVNTYADPELARKTRHWSDKRIYEELGIKLPDKTPKIRDYSQSTIVKKQIQYKRYVSLREIYIEPTKARELSKRSIKGVKESYKRDQRVNQWREWSKNDTYPRQLIKKARAINREVFNLDRSNRYKPSMTGVNENSSYGYMMLYTAFVEDRDLNELLKQYEADRSTGLVLSATGSP